MSLPQQSDSYYVSSSLLRTRICSPRSSRVTVTTIVSVRRQCEAVYSHHGQPTYLSFTRYGRDSGRPEYNTISRRWSSCGPEQMSSTRTNSTCECLGHIFKGAGNAKHIYLAGRPSSHGSFCHSFSCIQATSREA